MSTRLEIGRDRASGGFPLSLEPFFVRTIALTVLLPVSFALLLPVAAMEAPPLRFSQLAPADGLPQGHINAILQNDCGVMWFATQDGLALYDGYQIWTFHPDAADPNSLSNGFVRDLAAGPDDRIWIATDGGGLDVFDRETRIFTHYTHDENDPNSLSNDVVRTLHFDRSGTLWVGTNGGLNRFDPENNNFTHYRHDPAREDSLSNDPIRTIHDDDRGGLWIGTFGGGLNRLDIATGKFRHYRSSSSPYALRDDKIRSVYQDRWGSLWVGTYSEGLHRYVPEIDGFVVYNTKQGPAGPSGLTSNYILSILEDSTGNLWVGTDQGLNLWDPTTDRFTPYRHNPADRTSLIHDHVMSLYQDRGGVLWIGTQNGISRANLNVGSFGALSTSSPAEARLRSDDVKAIVEDLAGDVWIGTYGGGLHRWRVQEKTVEVYSPEESSKLPIIDNRIMSLLADSRGRLWVGTRSKGLQRIDADRKSVRSWRADKSDPNALHADGVTSILEGRDGEIWVGTYRGGLSRWDEEQSSFVTYRHDPNNPTSIGSDQITGLVRDRRGKLWIATDGAGLDRFDPENGQFTHFTASGKPGALGSNLIFAVLEDSKGDLWVATGGAGLYRWRVETRGRREASFEVYNSRNVLPNDTIYGILEDEFGKLWISSNAGLTRFDPLTEETAHFDVHDGLQSNEFNFGAFHRGTSGRLYFGGNNGINYFFATDIRTNTHVPDVRISGIDILNQPLDENQRSRLDGSLHLSHKDDVVTFRFASLDFTDPRKNQYSYMLEGFNEDWVDAGEFRQATYTSLPPGDYVFRVRGSNNDGIWSETDATVKIVVAPPPWATNYAYTLYLSLAVALVLYIWRRYTARLRAEERYSQTLEREVQRRTQQIEERNSELHEVNVRLEEASLTDALTGLRNRRYLLSQIPGEASHILRSWANGATPARRPSISFLMIDLDGFKEINDTYGHGAGDQVLLQLRDLLNDTCRAADYLIRWGGDEFLVVGKDAERENTERLATRLRNAIANHNFVVSETSSVHVSSSIGFARFPFLEHRPEALSWEQVLAVADRALYQAKHLGKDQWVGFSATPAARRERILRRLVDDPESLALAGEIRVHREVTDQPDEDLLSQDAG